ncbi:carbohydrate-binding domain-containing protein [uncultured Ruminococcus sp.]|uniref:carbohydrate-binding domain-containing protein n=1 Tax=uncultured Ruminococcus sp. TaxID=165186 RepID=UPI0026076139|nr:carbohydrate-binding domain-containing protein [uncultured Ruminococcus sp.]
MKRKHLLAGILSACILGSAAAAATVAGAAGDIVYGDTNCNGTLELADAILIMQSLANPSKYGIQGTAEGHLTEQGKKNGDVCERGGGLTSSDALAIQRRLLNLIPSLPESYAPGYSEEETTTTAPPQVTTTTTTQPVTTLPKEDVETKIHLNGSSITVDGKYAEANGSKVTISHSGNFYIDGSLNNGQIYVEVPDDKADPDTVKLILDGVNITGSNAPAILVKNADKTSITLSDGKDNVLSDGSSPYAGDNEGDAVIEAKDDLTIKGGDAGTGTLTITANCQPAVVCNNDIKITGGTLTIDTLNETEGQDAIKGKTSVTVKGGTVNIDSKGDGINSSKGNVDIEGGTLTIKSSKDALQAATELNISGGKIGAFGDKGLTTKEGTINITGGSLIATATDNQYEGTLTAQQSTLVFDFVKEWSKNNPIAVTDVSKTILFEENTLKKYRYAVVSSPDLSTSGDYKVFAGGIKMKHSTGNTFNGGTPASFTEVNNDMDNEDQLYGSFFDQKQVHKIDVKMSENDWKNFLSVCKNEEWVPCDLTIDGEEFKNVGIRAKGNSSIMMVNNGKYSFRFKLDKYDKYTNYHGLTEFCMNNFYSDASCMRDLLCYNAMYCIDGVAPKSSYSDMYVNGKLYSFYYAIEQPGTTLAERYGIDDDTNLYKATERSNQGGGMMMMGGDSYSTFTTKMPVSNLDLKFGKDEQLAHLEELKTEINKLSSSNYKFIEDIMDVPSFLKGFAVNSVMCNYDSYNGSLAHNYYLIYTGGKHYFVGWDYNLSLGAFMGGADAVNSDVTTSLYQAEIADRPFAKLLQVPEYYDMYVGYVKEILNYYSNPEQYVSEYASMIRPHVQADPLFFFNVDQFDSTTKKSANGLQTSGQQGQQQNPWGGQQQNPWGGQQGWNWQSNEPDGSVVVTDESWAFEGGWGGGFGGGGFGGGGFGGGGMMWGSENISVVDFLVKRFEIIHSALHY